MRAGGVNNMKNYKISVAGTGYVGLSIATLLSQHHHVTAVDIIPEKVEIPFKFEDGGTRVIHYTPEDYTPRN